jgi:hypothetical protein
MNSEGGDDNDVIAELFGLLAIDARESGLLCDRYYYLSGSTIRVCKRIQGYTDTAFVPGCALEQAFFLWNSAPRNTRDALLIANGLKPLGDVVTLPGIMIRFD